VSTPLLDPVLAWAECADGFVVELAAHGAFEDVGVDESLAVPCGAACAPGGKLTIAEVNVLPCPLGKGLLEQGNEGFGDCDAVVGIGVVAGAGWSPAAPALSGPAGAFTHRGLGRGVSVSNSDGLHDSPYWEGDRSSAPARERVPSSSRFPSRQGDEVAPPSVTAQT
jgi:hypothetical protein